MLTDLSIKEFAKAVANYEPVMPAGGCVTAVSGLMGVCLLEMSVNSVYSRLEGENHRHIKTQLAELHNELLTYIEKDAEAYNRVLAACKLSKTAPEEVEQRRHKIQEAALSAIQIPLNIAEACLTALEAGIRLIPIVKHDVLGDLKIGVLVTKAAIEGSLAAAKINLPLIKETELVQKFQARIDDLQIKFDTVKVRL